MKENLEQIKVALLAIIAGTLIIQTVMFSGKESDSPEEQGPENTVSLTPGNSPQIDVNAVPAATQVAEQKPSLPPTAIQFGEMSHDFGTIKQNSTNTKHAFKFTNTGTNPLVIETAVGSCGCTVPEWPKEPIPPGGTGEIMVDYKPGLQKGQQRKTVTITANTEPKTTQLTISASVEEVNPEK